MFKEFDVSQVIPSKENTARLLQELNQKQTCIMCEKAVATHANNSLCSACWQECEGMNPDEK